MFILDYMRRGTEQKGWRGEATELEKKVGVEEGLKKRLLWP